MTLAQTTAIRNRGKLQKAMAMKKEQDDGRKKELLASVQTAQRGLLNQNRGSPWTLQEFPVT